MLALNAERVAGFTSVRLFLDSIELALGVALRRGYSDSSIKMRSYRQGLTPLSLRKVIEFINDNLQCDLSLQQIADTAGLSVSHFSRMFRISTGSSPHQYLLKQRVHHGRELIGARDQSTGCCIGMWLQASTTFRACFPQRIWRQSGRMSLALI
jgi:AraC family transcriptional regulator